MHLMHKNQKKEKIEEEEASDAFGIDDSNEESKEELPNIMTNTANSLLPTNEEYDEEVDDAFDVEDSDKDKTDKATKNNFQQKRRGRSWQCF